MLFSWFKIILYSPNSTGDFSYNYKDSKDSLYL